MEPLKGLRLKTEVKTEAVRVRFSQDELRQVQEEARKQGRTVSGYLRWCWTRAKVDHSYHPAV